MQLRLNGASKTTHDFDVQRAMSYMSTHGRTALAYDMANVCVAPQHMHLCQHMAGGPNDAHNLIDTR